jgi:predicted esterase
MRKFLILIAAILFLGTVLYGDTFHLSSGRKLEGEVVKETEETVTIRTYSGITTEIPRYDIVKITSGESPAHKELKKRLKTVPKGDANAWFKLALWCERKKLEKEAGEYFKKTIKIDFNHAAARAKLGYVNESGIWVKAGKKSKSGKTDQAHKAARTPADTPLSKREISRLEKLVTEYFSNPSGRAGVLEKLKKKDRLDHASIKHFAKFALTQAKKHGLKVTQGESTFGHSEYRGLIYVKVQGNPKDKLPLFVALHGGGKGSGHWSFARKAWMGRVDKRLKNYIFFAPTVLHKNYAEWAGNPIEEGYVKEVMKAIKRSFNVDTNRVYMAGYSMGGYGTWHIGAHQADVFAGLCSGAGGILTLRGEPWGVGLIPNLMHTPIISLHGSNDRPSPIGSDRKANEVMNKLAKKYRGCFPHKYKEFPGGHQAAGQGLNSACDWMFKFKRKPYPKKVIYEPKRKFNKQLYWLKVNEPKCGTRLFGEIKGNTVNIKASNIETGFTVFLNDKLVDMKKPVIVKVNGKEKFKGMLTPSISAIVETIDDKIDEAMWFCARVDL